MELHSFGLSGHMMSNVHSLLDLYLVSTISLGENPASVMDNCQSVCRDFNSKSKINSCELSISIIIHQDQQIYNWGVLEFLCWTQLIMADGTNCVSQIYTHNLNLFLNKCFGYCRRTTLCFGPRDWLHVLDKNNVGRGCGSAGRKCLCTETNKCWTWVLIDITIVR